VLGLVFTGGEGPSRDAIEKELKEADLTAAADSGLLLAERLGVVPDLIVGDMDSIPDPDILRRYPDSELQVFARDKDYTDTELAIEALRGRGCSRVGVIGGGGGRLDHLLGIFSLFHRENAPDFWFTAKEELVLVRTRIRIDGWKDRRVSFFPVGGSGAAMTSRGLKWPLDALSWKVGDIGVSNVVSGEIAEVVMKTGRLVCIKSFREDET